MNLFESARSVPIDQVIDILQGLSNARRQSGRLVMPCPFHQDPTPSFTVYEKTNSFYCFGCGAGGDGIKFVEKLFSVPPREAAMTICQAFGLQRKIRQQKTGQQQTKQQEKRKMERALQAWADAAYVRLCELRRVHFIALGGFEEMRADRYARLEYIDYLLDLLQYGELADKLAVFRAVRRRELGLPGAWLHG